MLQRACPLRGAHEWSNPLLARARTYGRNIARPDDSFGLHDGICVTSKQYVGGTELLVPVSGFDCAQTFAPLSGPGLQRLCAECPAHAAHIAVAGCAGGFYRFPGSPELDEILRAIAGDLGLMPALEREFLPTRLLWFGLWADSPLSRGALETLEPLLREFCEREGDERENAEIANFVAAIGAALENDLALHVEMFAPGHTDFGWHSIFAHCPRCKAGAPIYPWQETPSMELECEMCGQRFDPAQTASREVMEHEESPSLLVTLGAERYRAFATGYLMERGADASEAQNAVQSYFDSEQRRQQLHELNQRKRAWQRAVLLPGLGRPREGWEEEDATVSAYWFSGAEVEELIARCRRWKVQLHSIMHVSDRDEEDETLAVAGEFGSLEAAYASLRAQGCGDKFYVGAAEIPDEIVQAPPAA